jgi:uncharacterized protein (TIGR00255 family)
MIKGMTGFGFSQVSDGKTKAIVEIKSVNHRYLDVNFYFPSGFGAAEERVRDLIQKSIHRGRVSVTFKFVQKPEQTISFNRNAIRQYLKLAGEVKKEFRLQAGLTVSDLVALPGVIEVKESLVDPGQLLPMIEKAVLTALKGMDHMRRREGKSLGADLNRQLKDMRAQTKRIESRARKILQQKRKVLPGEEFLSFQKSNDVNEELTRLIHYIDEFRSLLKTSLSIGKKLDFVAQEMQRETNTIGSKLQDALVADAVIALKSKIEKIREQAQNVE